MKCITIYILLIIIQLPIGTNMLYAQVDTDSVMTDSTQVINGIANYLDFYNTKWMTIGTQCDFLSSTFGLEISNGYDERPLIHFEDFTEDFVFKLQGNTDFNKDYSYGINLGWKYPRYLSLIALGFYEYDYSQRDFQYRDIYLTTETFIKNTDFVVMLKLAHQNLNDNKNLGADIGLSNVVVYRKLYAGISTGYYFDYFTYSGFLRGFLFKDIIGVQLDYKRIDKYDFLNLGLSFTFKR